MIKTKKITALLLVLLLMSSVSVFAQRGGSLGGSTSTQSATYSLTVNCDIRTAAVLIVPVNGNSQTRGKAPFTVQLAPGGYRVTVSYPGFNAETKEINLNSNSTLNFNLQQQNVNLTVTSNVQNARVVIQGNGINGQISGNASFTANLTPGTYTVRVNAPGYSPVQQTVNVNSTMTLNIPLQPQTARVNIIIPNSMLDYTTSNPAGRIKIYDNGSEINGNVLELLPGQHTIRVTSGGLAVQETITVRAGEVYNFELDFGFKINRGQGNNR